MKELQDDLQKIKELLRHSSEFIGYFELADKKMYEWREIILQHQEGIELKINHLHEEIDKLQELISETGLIRFRQQALARLSEGEEHQAAFETLRQQFFEEVQHQKQQLHQQMRQQLSSLEEHAATTMRKIEQQLARYDAQQFNRIANESCVYVEKVATKTLQKCQYVLRSYNWRSCFFSLLTAVVTALMLGLYLDNEFPWEQHQSAKNERSAGRMLLKVWPQLSAEEQRHIVSLSSSIIP